MTRIASFIEDRRAATAVEYSLVAALVAVAIIGSVRFVGGETAGMWGGVATAVASASS